MKKRFRTFIGFLFAVLLCAVFLTSCNTEHTHDFGEWTVTRQATCIETGERARTCSCGEKETETIEALGHTEVADALVPPTCVELGLKEGKHCSVCNEVTVKPKFIAMIPHEIDKDRTCRLCGQTNVPSQGLTFDSNGDGTCTVSGMGTCMETDLVIPSEHNGERVTAIMSCASRYVESIKIPDTVTSIGWRAFGGCERLKTVTLPNSLMSIGDEAFQGCYRLTEIEIPDSVTMISDEAFNSAYRLTDIVIPDSVTEIGEYAFYCCWGLTSVTVGNGVTLIDDRAFCGCEKLTDIKYNGTVKQWQEIILKKDWDTYIEDYTVICTDGTVAKDGTVTLNG